MTVDLPDEVSDWLFANNLTCANRDWGERLQREAPQSVKDAYEGMLNAMESNAFRLTGRSSL